MFLMPSHFFVQVNSTNLIEHSKICNLLNFLIKIDNTASKLKQILVLQNWRKNIEIPCSNKFSTNFIVMDIVCEHSIRKTSEHIN